MKERHPTRHTTAGRAYLDLQNKARREHRPTDELDQLYALEGFLARLAASGYADRFVVKGGVLLSAYDARRPTRDIDLQGQHISNQVDDILRVVQHIAAINLDDGLTFDTGAATASAIRDVEQYGGVRVSLNGTLSTARLSLHIDVNVGDPIWPASQPVTVPRLLGGELDVTGYPLHMILAEKIEPAGLGQLSTGRTTKGDLHPRLLKYLLPRPSVTRSTSCSRPTPTGTCSARSSRSPGSRSG